MLKSAEGLVLQHDISMAAYDWGVNCDELVEGWDSSSTLASSTELGSSMSRTRIAGWLSSPTLRPGAPPNDDAISLLCSRYLLHPPVDAVSSSLEPGSASNLTRRCFSSGTMAALLWGALADWRAIEQLSWSCWPVIGSVIFAGCTSYCPESLSKAMLLSPSAIFAVGSDLGLGTKPSTEAAAALLDDCCPSSGADVVSSAESEFRSWGHSSSVEHQGKPGLNHH